MHRTTAQIRGQIKATVPGVAPPEPSNGQPHTPPKAKGSEAYFGIPRAARLEGTSVADTPGPDTSVEAAQNRTKIGCGDGPWPGQRVNGLIPLQRKP